MKPPFSCSLSISQSVRSAKSASEGSGKESGVLRWPLGKAGSMSVRSGAVVNRAGQGPSLLTGPEQTSFGRRPVQSEKVNKSLNTETKRRKERISMLL